MKKIILALVIIAVVCGGCSAFNKLIGQKDDWFGEEILEEVIEAKTDMNIDLSPSSPEEKKESSVGQ